MSRFSVFGVLAFLASFILFLDPHVAVAQGLAKDVQLSLPADRTRMNENTVTIVTGGSHSIHLRLVEDMATVLDDGLDMRIIPMVGKGAVQNVFDLLHLKNIDMGITQADVLSYLKRDSELGPTIDRKLLYVTKLFNEELHLVASEKIADIKGLEGKRVNVGSIGSGTQLTSSLLFSALGINIVPVNMTQAEALAAIRSGKLDASLIIAGKPSPIFDIAGIEDGVRFLDIPYVAELENDYLPTILTAEDYPRLIKEDRTVDTIAVPAVLTVFNWAPTNDRYRRVAKLVNLFFDNVSKFRQGHLHRKWQELNLIAPLKGWRRFGPAQEWLDQHLARVKVSQPTAANNTAEPEKNSLVEFIRNKNAAASDLSPEAQDRLFNEFLEWQRQKDQPPPAAPAQAAQPAPAATPAPKNAAPGDPTRLW